MTKSITEMYEKELLASEKEKIYPELEIDVDKSYKVIVKYSGYEVGQLILGTRKIDFSPSGGMKIDLVVRNITPIKE